MPSREFSTKSREFAGNSANVNGGRTDDWFAERPLGIEGDAGEALQPSAAWIDEHKAVEPHMRAAIMMLPPGHRVQAVHSAMRAYVAADRPDPSAPRRGRPRRK